MPGEELRGPGTDWSRHPGVGGDTTAVSGLQGQTWLRSQMCRSLRRRGWGLEKAPEGVQDPRDCSWAGAAGEALPGPSAQRGSLPRQGWTTSGSVQIRVRRNPGCLPSRALTRGCRRLSNAVTLGCDGTQDLFRKQTVD